MRKWTRHTLSDAALFRRKTLRFFSSGDTFAFYDSCKDAVYGSHTFDWMCGAGEHLAIAGCDMQALRDFVDKTQDHCMGHVAYDVKNQLEDLYSLHTDRIGADEMYFFVPEILLRCTGDTLEIGIVDNPDTSAIQLLALIEATQTMDLAFHGDVPFFRAKTAKEKYLENVRNIREHIIAGDIYEMNYCQEFYAEQVALDPVEVFELLCRRSQAAYSVLYRMKNIWCISSSPELFLQKRGHTLCSKPIKGTRPRGKSAEEDAQLKNELKNSVKDRAENVMIVDLVRNDLTRSAVTGTIEVEELFGVYSFPQVHHLISVITAQLDPDKHAVDAIRYAFPMGSMTGAPKVRAMELIERYEDSKRGIYSGAIGFFTPEQDFTFNVVIRSLVYREDTQVISLHTGGAIVYDSDPEEEYAECMHKVRGVLDVLETDIAV
ncbi:MAG: aminodeoxychorismate synthase component I [Chitinophagales bacterium]